MTDRDVSEYLVEQQAHLYRLAYSYLHQREDALDAVQGAACRALECAHTLRRQEALRPWVYRIVVNECMDLLRRRKREVFLPPEELDTGSYCDPLPDDALSRRVDALPPEIQTIIKLRFYEDLPLQEIASITGCHLSTVKTRLYTGLRKLRIEMEGEFANE